MEGDDDDTLQLHLWYQRREPAHQLFWRGTPAVEPARTVHCDIVVIGAGPAGLTSAWLLQQLGYDVLVVENEPTLGGATRVEPWKGALVPCGALYFTELSPLVQELLRATHLPLLPLPDDALWLQGRIYQDFWRDSVLDELPLPWEERSAFRRFRTDLQTLPIPPYPLPDSLPGTWRRVAAQPAETFVRSYGSPTLSLLLDAYARSAMGATLDQVSTYCLRDFYSGEFGTAFQCPRYSFPGGLAALCQRLGEQLGMERIWRQTLAFRIEQLRPNRIRTLCLDAEGTIVAIDSVGAVVATPKFVAKHLLPELPPAQQQAMLRLRYAPYLTVHLLTPFRLVPEGTFDLWVPQARLFTDITDATLLQPKPTEHFVACIYAPLPTAQRGILLQEDKLRALVHAIVREALQLLAPERMEELDQVTCFVWGHALVIPTPEVLLGAAQQAARPVGPIVFAHTDNDGSPALENALEHALRAAETLHHRLRPHSPRPLIRRPTRLPTP